MLRQPARRYGVVLITSMILILISIYISLTNGEFDMTVRDIVETLLRIHPVPEHDLVVFDFRLPRIVIAALIGFALGMVGAVIQGLTRNGLADPGILGINAGAGAAIVIFTFLFQGLPTSTGWFAIMAKPLFGLVGGLAAAALIFVFAWKRGKLDPQRLILVGIAIGSGFGAVSLFLSLKMNPQDFEMATVWLTGSIWNANWAYIAAMLPWLLILLPIVYRKAHLLDLLQLEEISVKGLGVSTEREKMILLLCCIGVVSACVSVSGNIGFVGLLAPHMARRLVGIRHQYVLPISGTLGMLLVVLSDFISKTVFKPVELPVGIVISLIGVPYFIYLLFKARK
ncbi:iron ABC transporter permease [Paenibacillus selenitireducens]|uniref:Iron ABC transporter permease n=1 Tax=Paenibacillus selenitireducens TaxID=1324314 RepID=A0A1T2XHX6_9BACL|nr:iron ABC transporter permease [Paenibacillus selenitireducens]OPA79470.1 iron ABC transporter permease [Paenibacillus selenitireducens]